jgi:predicted Zn-dependent protease
MPREFRWHYLCAEALSDDGKVALSAAAMADAVRAMQTDSRALGADRLAAFCFLGDAAMRLNRPADARRMFRSVLEFRPDQPFALVRMGQLASREGNHADAAEYFRKALSSLPGRAEIRNLLAAEYRMQGDLARAEQTAVPPDIRRKAQPIFWPDPVRASVEELNQSGGWQEYQANRLLARGRWRSAAVRLAAGVAADPGSALKHAAFAKALLGLDEVEQARQEAGRARRLDPASDDFHALELRALASDPATAGKAVEQAGEWRNANPNSLAALQSAASVEFIAGRFAEALETLKELSARKPGDTALRLERARALSALGRYAEARLELAGALVSSPDDSRIKLDYSRFLSCSPEDRDGPLAVRLSREMLASEKNVVAMESLAMALAETGKFGEAASLIEESLDLTGDDAQPALTRRLNGELRAVRLRRPYRERWPFEDRK